ncbi:hypothetical protein DSO57_1036241 [Entomophthora muscae]|uniref:Uncharacterized protein n=1 Tax=Entomophthora muscae TaxID=34485 RepID=A0ACC2UKH1_9FUNG|nr:hypothetical protein DSO57_1036241 [Entomophthora muscae]
MKIPFFLSGALATWKFVEITSSVNVYNVTSPLILGKQMKWPSEEHFTSYHLNLEQLYQESICCSTTTPFRNKAHCFEKRNQAYLLGPAERVSYYVFGRKSEASVVTIKFNVTKEVKQEIPKPICLNNVLEYIVPTVPRGFSYANQATSSTNLSFTFQGYGFAYISFRPIYLLVDGIYTYKSSGFFHNDTKSKNVSYHIPVTLPDGSLDGVYKLEGFYDPDHADLNKHSQLS